MKQEDNTFNVTSANDSIGFLFWQAYSIWQQNVKKMLDIKYNLIHSHFLIMTSIHWLTLNDEEVTQITLSQHTKIEPMTVSQILKVLQKKNYILRKEHSVDTRAKAVLLTEEGKSLIKDAITDVNTIDDDFFNQLGDNAGIFRNSLSKLINNHQ